MKENFTTDPIGVQRTRQYNGHLSAKYIYIYMKKIQSLKDMNYQISL